MKLHPFALLALIVACRTPAGSGDGKDGEADGKRTRSGGSADVAGGAVTAIDKVTQCPQALGGSERVHRVISKDCGAVQVTEDYHVDGGSLTLEAGSSLSFKDGTGLHIGAHAPATLIVQGTAEAPVVLTAAGDRAAGVWHGVSLHAHADRSTIEGLVLEYAGNDEGALFVDASDVSLKGVKIRETKGPALVIGEAGSFSNFADNEMKKIGSKAAIDAPPRALGGLGGGNRFDAGAFVQVRGGPVDRSTRWQAIGAPLLIRGEVNIDGQDGQRAVVELVPGLELRFTAAGLLTIGAHTLAGLVAKGTAEAPIVFTAHERRTPGGWGGVGVHAQGEATLEQVHFEFGGKDEQMGALAVRGGQLSLREATFRSDRVGVTADEAAKLPVFADNTFVATPVAVALPAALIAALGEGNAYDRDSRIRTGGGSVHGEVTWHAQGVPIEFTAGIHVDGGELTLEPGVALLAAPAARLTIGEHETAALRVKGTFEAPVTIGPVDAARGRWPGISLAAHARGNTLENMVLTAVHAGAAIEVAGEVDVALRGVTCSKCTGAVVGWACGARVTSSQVLAADGTPRIDLKPEGC